MKKSTKSFIEELRVEEIKIFIELIKTKLYNILYTQLDKGTDSKEDFNEYNNSYCRKSYNNKY